MVASCSSASPFTMLLSPPNPSLSSSTRNSLFSLRSTFSGAAGGGGASSSFSSLSTPTTTRRRKYFSVTASAAAAGALQALIFDCDGVILESEHLHRQAYNDAFSHFKVRCSSAAPVPLNWGLEFYDELQNRIGGGKPKMRWYFKEYGWPSSTIFETPPENDMDREKLIDIVQVEYLSEIRMHFARQQPSEAQMIRSEAFPSVPKDGKLPLTAAVLLDVFTVFAHQDWKTERYKEILKSGTVEPRPGVLRLMDEAKAAGKKLAVCSAATKSSVILCLENLIGLERFQGLDCFLAGDDVKEKKPDPSIYLTAAKKLGVSGGDCLVVEDSVIGLQAATLAGMPCIITYTSSTANQDFKEAIAKYPDLGDVRLKDLEILLQSVVAAN